MYASEIFFSYAREISCNYNGIEYNFYDHYCLNEGCKCNEVLLVIIQKDEKQNMKNSPVVRYNYNEKTWQGEKIFRAILLFLS